MRPTLLTSLLVGAVAASQLGATDCGQILADRGFDLWCGDQLCYWKLEAGDIERVPTWIEGDDGVLLEGDEVALSQMTAVTSSDTACIEFELVADIDEAAEVRLEADIFGDGSVDWSERIPSADWEKVSFRIGIEDPYEGIKFRITKVGAGHAVLAQIEAHTADREECPSFVDIVSRPLGASCWLPDDCDSGICNAGRCSTCATDDDCSGGDVCGAELHAPGGLHDWYTCVAPGSRQLGEICHQDAECANGVCNGIACSECSNDTACGDGAECVAVADDLWVEQCATAGRPAGADCFTDDDCASGACAGTPLGHCDDNVLPCFGDAECPPHPDNTPATCTFVAVAGGTCQ